MVKVKYKMEKPLEDIMAETFSNLVKTKHSDMGNSTNPQARNKKKTTPSHCIIKSLKTTNKF